MDFAVLHAKALSLSRLPGRAIAAADKAMALGSNDPASFDTLGFVYAQAGNHEQAIGAFRRAVSLAQAHASYRFNLATSLVAVGDIDAAEKELETCIELAPHYWEPHLSLAQLRTQTDASNHIARLVSLLSQHRATAGAQIYLNMALTKEYEDLGAFPQAFDHLVQGKSAARRGRAATIKRDQSLFARLTEAFSQAPPTDRGDPTEEPIFVFGMPRTGTTLVERILSSHPDVHAAGELQNFAAALQRQSPNPLPILEDPSLGALLPRIDWRSLGAHYLASTRPATGHVARFVDKLPHNFLYAGFIAAAMPRAKMICLRRDPLDTCLSNFRQLFPPESSNFDYTYDLLDAGRYYVFFDRLIAHWQRLFPGRILEVSYEALIEQQEAQSHDLLAFCGLPWNEACMRFELNPAPVSTFSAVQVREPLSRRAIERWKNYDGALTELRALLTDAGVIAPR